MYESDPYWWHYWLIVLGVLAISLIFAVLDIAWCKIKKKR